MTARAAILALAALTILTPGATAALPAACTPSGSSVVDGQVVRWQRAYWFCATEPRRLEPLPVPAGARSVGNVVARGRFMAFSYYLPLRSCDDSAAGARSIDLRTGAVRYDLAPYTGCVHVYGWYVSDVALRPDTGAFAVIRGMQDMEDDLGHAAVIRVNGAGVRVLDHQEDSTSAGNARRHRIMPYSLSYSGHRLRWRHLHGPQTGRM